MRPGAFLDYVSERRRRWPDMHIYHYADYERAALLRLAGEFGEGEDQVDDLLRAGVLVDLYPIVRGSIMVGSSSYGLKALEPLFLPEKRQGDVTTAGDSVVQYAAYCLEREQDNVEAASEVKKDILNYNEQDCRSTLLLRDWLLTRLTEQPTPVPAVRPDSTTAGVRAEEEAAVAEPLWQMAGVDARTPEQQGFALLAAAVGFHRREEKPFWWGHFDRLDNPPETWADARDALLIEECTVTQDWTKTGRANPRPSPARARSPAAGIPAWNGTGRPTCCTTSRTQWGFPTVAAPPAGTATPRSHSSAMMATVRSSTSWRLCRAAATPSSICRWPPHPCRALVRSRFGRRSPILPKRLPAPDSSRHPSRTCCCEKGRPSPARCRRSSTTTSLRPSRARFSLWRAQPLPSKARRAAARHTRHPTYSPTSSIPTTGVWASFHRDTTPSTTCSTMS